MKTVFCNEFYKTTAEYSCLLCINLDSIESWVFKMLHFKVSIFSESGFFNETAIKLNLWLAPPKRSRPVN